MRELPQHRHSSYVERVAGSRLKSPNAALAEDDIRVAVGGDVLRGQQQLLDGRAEPTFQHDRPARFTQGFQKSVILHISRADLEHVSVLGHQSYIAVAHNL